MEKVVSALPTPDDLIALLSESVTWHTPTPEGPRATISPQWVERMAEAILARLRPAWEALQAKETLLDLTIGRLQRQVNASVTKEVYAAQAETVTQLRAERDELQRKGESLCGWVGVLLTSLEVSTPEAAVERVSILRASLARKDEALRTAIPILDAARDVVIRAERLGAPVGSAIEDLLEIAREVTPTPRDRAQAVQIAKRCAEQAHVPGAFPITAVCPNCIATALAAREAETREACAKLADEITSVLSCSHDGHGIAASIRASAP